VGIAAMAVGDRHDLRVERVRRSIDSCLVVLAVIGRDWLVSDDGAKRLDEPDDPVLLELTTALASEARVVPVLVQGASMPKAEDLPEALRPLTRLNALNARDEMWHSEVDRLASWLSTIIQPGGKS
jgi:hypothetical protein